MNKRSQLTVDLHFIGHKAEKLQAMYKGYSPFPNEYGSFLRFENYTFVAGNNGTILYTNCFDSEAEFMENLTSKMLLDL